MKVLYAGAGPAFAGVATRVSSAAVIRSFLMPMSLSESGRRKISHLADIAAHMALTCGGRFL
ncbi:hypothetical protein GCM10029964_009480 [Kibdelosporangium lantanae]